MYPARERLRNWPPSREITTTTRYLAANHSDFHDYEWRIDPRCNSSRRRCIPGYHQNQASSRVQLGLLRLLEWGDADARWGSLFIWCHAFHAPFLHSMVVCSWIGNYECTIVRNVGNEYLSFQEFRFRHKPSCLPFAANVAYKKIVYSLHLQILRLIRLRDIPSPLVTGALSDI